MHTPQTKILYSQGKCLDRTSKYLVLPTVSWHGVAKNKNCDGSIGSLLHRDYHTYGKAISGPPHMKTLKDKIFQRMARTFQYKACGVPQANSKLDKMVSPVVQIYAQLKSCPGRHGLRPLGGCLQRRGPPVLRWQGDPRHHRRGDPRHRCFWSGVARRGLTAAYSPHVRWPASHRTTNTLKGETHNQSLHT